jgi:cation-transporting ATPase 13A1
MIPISHHQQQKRLLSRLGHYHTIIPLYKRSVLLRLDTLPFLILYSILIVLDTGILGSLITCNSTTNSASNNNNCNLQHHVVPLLQHWTHILLFPLAFLSHIALFLAGQWSVWIRAHIGYSRQSHAPLVQGWTTHCLVIPPSNGGTSSPSRDKRATAATTTTTRASKSATGSVGRIEIVPVVMMDCDYNNEVTKSDNETFKVAVISYEEIIFRCCIGTSGHAGQDLEMDSIWTIVEESKHPNSSSTVTEELEMDHKTQNSRSWNFHRLHFPIDLPLKFYTLWKGHGSEASLMTTRKVYGDNRLIISLPLFTDLLYQQLLAPFFLFQLLCVLLWCLDEYWYYAIFTLFTLILFECTVAHSRLKNLQRLRETLRPPFGVWVYRSRVWERIPSESLVAGDIVSLSSNGADEVADGYGYGQDVRRAGAGYAEVGTHVPCDMLLLKGSAVLNEAMLTGESVPQLKESIDVMESALDSVHGDGEPVLDMEDAVYKRAILFGGTVVMNHSGESAGDESVGKVGKECIPSPPDGGCVALVLRTGFDTQQGSLLRTMVHTSTKSQSDGVNTRDTFLFIVGLLFCAILSSAFVLYHGWDDPKRNRFKLVLHVIIIVTSVVPPELPMELSLAVTSSLADLVRRCSVYCTEPFRIPLAGMVDTCCFDKTGTLTSDEMVLRGVRIPVDNGSKLDIAEELVQPSMVVDTGDESSDINFSIPSNTLRVMVGCQSLALSSNGRTHKSDLIGDPLEKAVLNGCGWTLLSNDTVAPPEPLKNTEWLKIRHRFAFTSKLKRMTVLAQCLRSGDLYALSKGAPETLKEFFDPSTIPGTYDDVSMYHMSKGQRVLAMGQRKLGSKDSVELWKKRGRRAIESNLTFVGFIVLDCPLKPDSKKIIKELKKSGHSTVMITGDAVLTAVEVARQVGIIKSRQSLDVYELKEFQDSASAGGQGNYGRFAFVPIGISYTDDADTSKVIAYSSHNLEVIKDVLSTRSISAICVTGDTLTRIAIDAVHKKLNSGNRSSSFVDSKTVLLHPDAQALLQTLVPLISVFARHAPRQKEAVVAAFNGAGRITLMCGDGTNDVGALKMSHCGISIISVPDLEAKQREAITGLTKKNKDMKKSKLRSKTLEDHMRALAEAEEELHNVALGDASVASPFTSRATSIKCTKDVLQRGRCTLVTMTQIYKILGVNCLVNALVLSSLHLSGAKQGDYQLTVVGIIVAGLFFFVTKGEPVNKLSPHRPPPSVLCKQVVTSITSQFAIHFTCITAITVLSKFYLDPYDPSLVPDGAFNPNTLNSATFVMTVLTTVNTFVVNYRGRPYMQDLVENKMMLKSVQLCYLLLFGCVLELFPPLNDFMQLAPFPRQREAIKIAMPTDSSFSSWCYVHFVDSIGFKWVLCVLMVADTSMSYYVEKYLVRYFEPDDVKQN